MLHKCESFICEIEHVGSTSIPGMLAKPLIDIAIMYESANSSKLIKSIISLGYEHIKISATSNRLYFVKRVNGNSLYHVHAYQEGNEHYYKQIAFRDILINNSNLAYEYIHIKNRLYTQYKDNREEYTARKSEFINSVLRNLLIKDS
ncbi:GrpB family protein [Clostridiaceae bacterium M8S5]|nr:GrpB family protein [Clostridiaceae bacterium M8S5]